MFCPLARKARSCLSLHHKDQIPMHKMTFVAVAALAMATGYAAAQTMPGSVHSVNGVMMDGKGMTLYTFDNDKEANRSACNGNCANAWPALKAEASDED